jgi:hypothetical protein
MTRLTEDKRPIKSISSDEGRYTLKIGQDGITKIEVYEEMGQMTYIPWIAIWKGDVLSIRMDVQGKSIEYL